jgi:hypothetical protein
MKKWRWLDAYDALVALLRNGPKPSWVVRDKLVPEFGKRHVRVASVLLGMPGYADMWFIPEGHDPAQVHAAPIDAYLRAMRTRTANHTASRQHAFRLQREGHPYLARRGGRVTEKWRNTRT